MSSSSNARSGPKYEATAAHLRKVLDGFSTAFDDTQLSGHAYEFSVPRSKLPTAVLAHEVMVIFGAVYLGREEKMEWQYGFTVCGIPCNLASTKWGLRLCLDAAVGDPEA